MTGQGFIVWGFEGTLKSIEHSLVLRNPIVHAPSDTNTLQIARRYPYKLPSDFFLVQADSISTHGTRLESSDAIHLKGTDRLALFGSRYGATLSELCPDALEGWHFTPEGSAYRAADPTAFRHIARYHTDLAVREFRNVLAEMDPGLPNTWAVQLLNLLEHNPETSRRSFYTMNLAYQLLSGAQPEEIERTTAFGAFTTRQTDTQITRAAVEFLHSFGREPSTLNTKCTDLPSSLNRQELLHRIPLSELAARLLHARDQADAFRLSFADPSNPSSAERFSTTDLSVLANLLCSEFGDLPLAVLWPPATDPFNLVLRRSGIAFALGATGHRIVSGDADLTQFSEPYHPSDGQMRLELVAGPDINADSRLLSVADPHLRPRRELNSLHSFLIKPWLENRSGLALENDAHLVRRLFSQVGLVIVQLLQNVRDHANLNQYSVTDHSLLQLFITRGGRAQSSNRLWILVMDTGVGIPFTIHKRFPEFCQPEEALEAALFGRLPRGQSDRRFGLPDVRAVCDWYAGEQHGAVGPRLFVATENSEAAGAIIGDYRPGRKLNVKTHDDLPIRGTVVVVSLPLHRLPSHDMGETKPDFAAFMEDE